MPLTLAHPAAAVPLARPLGRHGVLSALVVGSMAPDFVYQLPLAPGRATSHSALGLVTWCLPAGLAVWALFHLLWKPGALALLPALARRLPEEQARAALPRASLLAVALSIVLGAATHDLWDGFTHASGFAVRALPFLRTHWAVVDGYPLSPYKLLQHAGTVGGLALLLRWSWRWLRARPVRALAPSEELPARSAVTAALALFALVSALARSATLAAGTAGTRAVLARLAGLYLGAAGALALGLVVVGLAARIRAPQRSR